MNNSGKRWTVQNRDGNAIYLTEERKESSGFMVASSTSILSMARCGFNVTALSMALPTISSRQEYQKTILSWDSMLPTFGNIPNSPWHNHKLIMDGFLTQLDAQCG
jgi:hypothetical protein